MLVPSSKRSQGSSLKVFSKEKSEFEDENELVLTQFESSMFAKKLKTCMKLQKKVNNKEDTKIGEKNLPIFM